MIGGFKFMKDFRYVDFEDEEGKLASLSFSDLNVWDADKQEYIYDEYVLEYAYKMYNKCKDVIFSSFLRKIIDYDENMYADVDISEKQIYVTVYSRFGHGVYPLQFNFRFKNNTPTGNIVIHLA